jgi:hypothetical protein
MRIFKFMREDGDFIGILVASLLLDAMALWLVLVR